MLEADFDTTKIVSVEFGVKLKNDHLYSVPVDKGVQDVLLDIFRSAMLQDGKTVISWEKYNVSEDYGPGLKLYSSLDDDLMKRFNVLYTSGSFHESDDLSSLVPEIDFYFAVFHDKNGRKAMGLKKATRFKGIVGERNRVMQLFDNTLKLIENDVFRLENDFDVVLSRNFVFILRLRPFEIVAGLQQEIAAAAQLRISQIGEQITFLDLSGLSSRISKHPRSARVATSISKRDDLVKIKIDTLKEVASSQNIKFLDSDGGKIRPRVADEHKLLEILDDRRYVSRLTGEDVPYIARSRVKAPD